MLAVSPGHQVAWSSSGAAADTSVCIVHGGPGGRSRPESAQWFAPAAVRWVMFDQRACGRSTCDEPLAHNTLADLVSDMEALRLALGIERWAICGGSWGALVALRYALAFPDRVTGLMFRSPFLGTPRELAGFFSRMPAWLGAQGCQALNLLPDADGTQVLQKLAEHLLYEAQEQSALAARVWEAFENDLGETAVTKADGQSTRQSTRLAQALSSQQASASLLNKFRLQAHYLSQACFLEPDWQALLEQGLAAQAKPLEHTPVEVVHGDSDLVCPPYAAEQLLKLFPHAQMTWVPGAGHDMREPAMHEALTQAATRLMLHVQEVSSIR